MKYLLLTVFFVTTKAFAAEVAFFCKSDGWNATDQYDRAYYKTVGCEYAKAWTVNNAKRKAQRMCRDWAKYYKVQKFVTEITNNCHFRSGKIDDAMDKKRMNKVQRVSDHFSPGNTEMGYTYLYIDNRGHEQAIYNGKGQEQAQWIHRKDAIYCGFVDADIRFYKDAKQLTVIRELKKEKAIYIQSENDPQIFVTKSTLDSIRANYIHLSAKNLGQNFITFFNQEDGEQIKVRQLPIFYSEHLNYCE